MAKWEECLSVRLSRRTAIWSNKSQRIARRIPADETSPLEQKDQKLNPRNHGSGASLAVFHDPGGSTQCGKTCFCFFFNIVRQVVVVGKHSTFLLIVV